MVNHHIRLEGQHYCSYAIHLYIGIKGEFGNENGAKCPNVLRPLTLWESMRIAQSAAVAVLAIIAIGIVVLVVWSFISGSGVCGCSQVSEVNAVQSSLNVLMADNGLT